MQHAGTQPIKIGTKPHRRLAGGLILGDRQAKAAAGQACWDNFLSQQKQDRRQKTEKRQTRTEKKRLDAAVTRVNMSSLRGAHWNYDLMSAIEGWRGFAVTSVWIEFHVALWGGVELTHPCVLTVGRAFEALLTF